LVHPGHYLGMDIHDCSMVSFDSPLKPGVVSSFPDKANFLSPLTTDR